MAKSLIYEVNIEVEKSVSGRYEEWLKPHIEALLQTGCFTGAKSFKKVSDPGDPDMHYTVHYYSSNFNSVDNYLKNYAPAFRADAEKNFSGKMRATRRILEEF